MSEQRFLLSSIVLVSLVLTPLGITRSAAFTEAATTITFTAQELLGKPEATSMAINIVPASTIQYQYQYGTSSGSYTGQTANHTATGGQPSEVTITGLSPSTQYYYRMRYHLPGETDWVTRPEHSFWTQRAQGSTFYFTVTADSHESFTATEQNAMTNIWNEHPDFNIDLGDTFITDNLTSQTADQTQTAVNNKYLAYRKPLYFEKFCHSVPIFLSSGNHENEEGWNLDDTYNGTPNSLAQASIQARKLYYPTPINDGFFSGNSDPLAAINAGTYGDQYREDYYAWTWGDALFVVIDPFQYTMNLPYAPVAGEGTDDSKTGDQWSWTLGAQQYNWLMTTLQNSTAKYKFMFSHQMVGGITRGPFGGAEAGYVRGGAEAAGYFEWGGANADGSAGFAAHRDPAVFGTRPIHQLMRDYGVSGYFHGHDHQYVHETRDGIVYQEVPSPGTAASAFSGVYTQGDVGTYNTIKILPNSGHLRITVAPTKTTVDYVSSTPATNGTVQDSYDIHTLTTAVSPPGGGTISPAAGTYSYNNGQVVSVTATPNAGYTFSAWSGACTGSGTCLVTMDANKTVTANFTANVPSPPTGVSASDGNYSDKVQVSWSVSSGATSYQVYRNTSNASSGAAQIGTPSATSFDDTAATPTTIYYYFVKACNGAGCSGFSASDSGYRSVAPPNDDFAGATPLVTVPFLSTVDTTNATTAVDDPALTACDRPAGTKSVWYSYTPGTSRSVYLDTFGSNYDTMMGVFTGSRGNLTAVACNDDDSRSPSGINSAVSLSVTAGTTYYIVIYGFAGTKSAFASSFQDSEVEAAAATAATTLQFHATSFYDVPGNYQFWRYIEGFYAQGITTGCSASPLSYCPGSSITRDQMAVFLLRAMHGASYQPPAATGIFADPSVNLWMQAWVEEYYREGITTGCGANPLRYCPEDPVKRADMAVFISRAYSLTQLP